MMRSPSFSRSSSSTTTRISPRAMAATRPRCGDRASSSVTVAERPRHRHPVRGAFQQALDVLGDDVDLEVHGVARALAAEGGDLGGVRDDGDGEAVVGGVDDGEADAVDGDRALLHDVAEQSAGMRDAQVGRRRRRSRRRASTWPCTRWPPRRSLEAHGPLEVDRVARARARRGGAGVGLVDDVGLPPALVGVPADDGEAAAVDGDGAPISTSSSTVRGGDAQPRRPRGTRPCRAPRRCR